MSKIASSQINSSALLLGNVDRATSMSGFSAETQIVSVTVDVPTTNRLIKVSLFLPQVYSSVSTDRFTIRLKEAGTTIQQSYTVSGATGGGWCGTILRAKSAPSAGSVAYSATIQRDQGTGTLTVWSESTSRAQLIVELI